jgi:hypothetical protein
MPPTNTMSVMQTSREKLTSESVDFQAHTDERLPASL